MVSLTVGILCQFWRFLIPSPRKSYSLMHLSKFLAWNSPKYAQEFMQDRSGD